MNRPDPSRTSKLTGAVAPALAEDGGNEVVGSARERVTE
jgi:hypothetical protein